jgi:hypothetical protein
MSVFERQFYNAKQGNSPGVARYDVVETQIGGVSPLVVFQHRELETTGSAIALAFVSNVTAGHRILVCFCQAGAQIATATFSIADLGLNTFTVVVTNSVVGTSCCGAIWTAPIVGGGGTTDQITVTITAGGGAGNNIAISIWEVAGGLGTVSATNTGIQSTPELDAPGYVTVAATTGIGTTCIMLAFCIVTEAIADTLTFNGNKLVTLNANNFANIIGAQNPTLTARTARTFTSGNVNPVYAGGSANFQ